MVDAFFRLSKNAKTYETIFYCNAFKTLIVNNFYLLLSISMISALHNLPKILLAMSCMNLYDFVPLVNKDGSGCLLLVQRLRKIFYSIDLQSLIKGPLIVELLHREIKRYTRKLNKSSNYLIESHLSVALFSFV